MADENALPIPQPVATAAPLPPPAPVPTLPAGQLPPPAPVAMATPVTPAPEQSTLLPSPEPVPTSAPMSDKTTDMLDTLKQEAEKAFAGPGSFFGTNPQEKDLPGTENQSWIRRKAAIMNQLSSSPIANLDTAITPEERAEHPHVAAALDPVAHTITALTTPKSLAFIGSLGMMETLPKFLETELAGAGISAATAAKYAKATQAGLTAMGTYFTGDQIATALEKIPEAAQALMHGEYDKAIGLTTSAVINGALGGKAFHDTYASLHGLVPESTAAKAMANKEYADAVHADQQTKQVGGARKQQLSDLGRTSVADQLKREQQTEYIDAKGNREVMRARQKETANPVSPTQRIEEQGGAIPLDNVEAKPVATNASGESEASQEAINRVAADKAKNVTYEKVDSRKPEAAPTPLLGVGGADATPGPYDHIVRNNEDGSQTIMTSGTKARPIPMREARPAENVPANAAETAENKPAAKAEVHDLGNLDEELPKSVQEAIKKPDFISKAVAERQGLFSDEAKENAQKPGAATPEHWASPAAQQAAETATAVARAEEAARAHVITPEERDLMVKQQDPDFKMTKKQEGDLEYARQKINELGQRAQKLGILAKNQLRDWFVPREWDFEDPSDPTKATLFDSHHEGQMHGLVSKNKDYWALISDYYGKMTRRIADTELTTRLKTGRMEDGSPLGVGGGFVEGQRVSTEGPQSHIMGDNEINRLKSQGKFNALIENGRIVANPDKSFTMKTDDYVPAKNLYEVRPIGPTPIPPEIVKEMETDGTLAKLQEKGLVYKNEKGEWINKTPLYARVPVYVHPDIAEHINEVVRPREAQPSTAFGRALKGYDDIQGNMKNMLLSWSPFHKATESWRMMESLGLIKGGGLAARTNIASLPGGSALLEKTGIGLPPPIDYFNLTPVQEAAIRDGIVITDPRGASASNVEEGLSGGERNITYRAFDKTFGAGLEKVAQKMGTSPETAAAIRRNINPQKILTDDVFGPHGMISSAKFKLYEDRKPLIASQVAKDHPSWSPEEVDSQAGRIAARFANDKFGGLNYVLLGRSLSTQKVLRRLLLAPDFLESTGRSIADIAGQYGNTMAANLVRFNIAHMLTAAGINLALHHEDGDTSVKGALRDSHILDHPYGVVSGDGKSVYGLRTTTTDFLHLLNQPKEFAFNRVAPPVRAAYETATQRNEYGRKESLGEAAKAFPKATLPIQVQPYVGLAPNTTTEPTPRDQFLKSIGIQARPNRSVAEQLAIDKVSQHLQGTEALTGQALVRSQLKFNAEDTLRSAIEALDKAKKDPQQAGNTGILKSRVDAATNAVKELARRKVISPEDQKQIMLGAKMPRVAAIFKSLPLKEALPIWDVANDEEKAKMYPLMQHKFADWKQKITHEHQNLGKLNVDDQEILDHFTRASIEGHQILERPLPPAPKAKAAALPKPAPVPAELPAPVPVPMAQ